MDPLLTGIQQQEGNHDGHLQRDHPGRSHRRPHRPGPLIQALKKYIPEGFTALTSLGVSLLLGVIAIAATNGFTGYGWGVVLAAVVGVAQAVYTLVNQALNGALDAHDHKGK